MKIEIEPTGTIQEVNGTRRRIWEGKNDKVVPVKAWIATVSPQTNDEAINAEFARDLKEVKGEHHAHAYDLRLFVD